MAEWIKMGHSPVLRVLGLEPPGIVVRGGRVCGGGTGPLLVLGTECQAHRTTACPTLLSACLTPHLL